MFLGVALTARRYEVPDAVLTSPGQGDHMVDTDWRNVALRPTVGAPASESLHEATYVPCCDLVLWRLSRPLSVALLKPFVWAGFPPPLFGFRCCRAAYVASAFVVAIPGDSVCGVHTSQPITYPPNAPTVSMLWPCGRAMILILCSGCRTSTPPAGRSCRLLQRGVRRPSRRRCRVVPGASL